MQALLGFSDPMIFFDVLLHMGTLAAVLLVYRSDILAISRDSLAAIAGRGKNIEKPHGARFFLMIIVGSLPAAVIGLLFEDVFEKLFASTFSVGCFLIVTGTLLFATRKAPPGKKKDENISVRDALLIGLAQAMAITPGISRSGATIAVAIFLGVERETAAKFSFLLSVPAIIGAGALKYRSAAVAPEELPLFFTGTVLAFIVGVAALLWLIQLVKKGRLEYFAWYCWSLGLLAILAW